MPADFAGALQAINDKFVAEWVDGSEPRTRVVFVNKDPDDPWPPKDQAGHLLPYVLAAPQGATGDMVGVGMPGNHVYRYDGLIHLHVYVPVGAGTADAFAMAVAAGDIFRARKFYDDVTDGCYVRSWTPRVDGGGPGDDDGICYRVTATIPFEYWHRG
jgi:hypothetical protein